MKRRKLTKQERMQIYDKYRGHCAYCGNKIKYTEMQVDHIKPLFNGGLDQLENMNPSCRLCNHYKRSASLEFFRNVLLGGITERLHKIYIFRVAEKYGMITINKWDKKFYFERRKK